MVDVNYDIQSQCIVNAGSLLNSGWVLGVSESGILAQLHMKCLGSDLRYTNLFMDLMWGQQVHYWTSHLSASWECEWHEAT